ncbi:MAG: glycoside hydrolase family 130 protein [Hyphomonadaceae bacterium]
MPLISHKRLRLKADPSRVVIRPFHIAPEPRDMNAPESGRMRRIVDAVSAMDMRTVQAELSLVNTDFEPRHWQTRRVYLQRYEHIMAHLDAKYELREIQKELIGAYFCHEYSYAAAALMNPSVAPHHDQTGVPEGKLRILMSLRAVGEGHISSIAFREGILTRDGSVSLMPEPPFAVALEQISPTPGENSGDVLARRPESVSLSGSVIFPFTRAQRNGLEDLRLVRFEEEDGAVSYYGTYTAYSGAAIASELLCTRDFHEFEFRRMSGGASVNKGMALFPRRIDGRYAMIGRQDGESLYFLDSESLTHWEGGEKILAPRFAWELVQIGNCGPPIELDEGWLLLTHGVGAMRQYSIGAALLDKTNPRKVLGQLSTPLLSPSDENREGYVPNVVYTCGGLKHGDMLFLPYGVADSSIAFCTVDLPSLLKAM